MRANVREYDIRGRSHYRRRRRHNVASSGRRVDTPWPRRMACLQRSAGTDPVSLRSWSVQRVPGRPGRRLQALPSERPSARPTWQCRALCVVCIIQHINSPFNSPVSHTTLPVQPIGYVISTFLFTTVAVETGTTTG